MTDTEFRQAITTLILKDDDKTDVKIIYTQEQVNENIIRKFRSRVNRFSFIWNLFFRVKE